MELENSEIKKVQIWVKLGAVILTLGSVFIYFSIYFTVPVMVDMFDSFGSDVPQFTELVMSGHRWFFVAAAIGLIPTLNLLIRSVISAKGYKVSVGLVWSNLALALLVKVVVIVALYIPIYNTVSII